MNDTNVGLGMAPHRNNCGCDDCCIDRLRDENNRLRRALKSMPCMCTKYDAYPGGPVVTCKPVCARCAALERKT